MTLGLSYTPYCIGECGGYLGCHLVPSWAEASLVTYLSPAVLSLAHLCLRESDHAQLHPDTGEGVPAQEQEWMVDGGEGLVRALRISILDMWSQQASH